MKKSGLDFSLGGVLHQLPTSHPCSELKGLRLPSNGVYRLALAPFSPLMDKKCHVQHLRCVDIKFNCMDPKET